MRQVQGSGFENGNDTDSASGTSLVGFARRYSWSVKIVGATGWFGIRREFAADYSSVVRQRSASSAQRTDIDRKR
jgi:hypothetical protein